MTTAKTVASVPSPLQDIVREILIADLNDASWNARKTYDLASIEELAQSIRLHKVQVPLIVRMVDAADRAFEIVAGHRRFHAAQKAGLQTVPCLVRNLNEDEAREVGLVDNLQRENVPAMEEAVAFEELLSRLGSIAAVAARLGKEQSYVAKRLKLCSITPCGQDALRERLITIDHALLLARVGADEQDELLKWCLDPMAGVKKKTQEIIEGIIREQKELQETAADDLDVAAMQFDDEFEPKTVLQLKARMQKDSGTLLSRAPWPLDEDYLIPDDPICTDCPQNTKANAPLFGDLEIGEATCTDGSCFQSKTEGFVQIRLADAQRAIEGAAADKAKAPAPLRVSWKLTSTAPRLDKDSGAPVLKQTFKAGQWAEAKKKCEYARIAVTADWSDSGQRGYMGSDADKLRKPGEIISVCIEPKCKVHPKDWAKPKGASSRGQREDPALEKRRQELQDFYQKEEPKLRSKVFSAILSTLNVSRAIHDIADDSNEAPAWRKTLLAAFPKLDGDSLEAFTAFCCNFDRLLNVNSYYMAHFPDGIADGRKRLWAFAKQHGVNADAAVAKHYHDEGSIAPAADALYPKGIPWPKRDVAKPAAAKKPSLKKTPAKKAVKKAVKKAAKKAVRK